MPTRFFHTRALIVIVVQQCCIGARKFYLHLLHHTYIEYHTYIIWYCFYEYFSAFILRVRTEPWQLMSGRVFASSDKPGDFSQHSVNTSFNLCSAGLYVQYFSTKVDRQYALWIFRKLSKSYLSLGLRTFVHSQSYPCVSFWLTVTNQLVFRLVFLCSN